MLDNFAKKGHKINIKLMPQYNVTFHYTIQIEAKNKKEATEQAYEDYLEMPPRLKETSVDVEKIVDFTEE